MTTITTTENDNLIAALAKARDELKAHVKGPICGSRAAEDFCFCVEKIEAFIRKLRVGRGETLLDIGYEDGDVVMQLVRGAVLVKILTAIHPDGRPGYEIVGFYGSEDESTFTMDVDDHQAITWVTQTLAGYQEEQEPQADGPVWLQEPPISP